MKNDTPLKVMLCAGEVSGDMYGAALMEALRARYRGRQIEFFGMGGDAMRAAGADIRYHTDDLGAMGLVEVLKKIGFFKRVLADMVKLASERKPDVLVTIDYYSFNVKLAEQVKARVPGIKTVQYVSPKVWAWRRNRVHRIAAAYDRMLCIFPFEPAIYQAVGLNADYVGHPLVGRAEATRRETSPALPWYGKHHIAILPGSRAGEIRRILPTFLHAAHRIERVKHENCSFIIPVPTARMRAEVERIVAAAGKKPMHLSIVDGQARHVLMQSRAAMIASGTATLEACLMDCPAVLAYRMHPLTAAVAWLLLHRNKGLFAGLVNIIAGREVMPELLQRDFTYFTTASLVLGFLRDTPDRQALMKAYAGVRAQLGGGEASEAAAAAIADELGDR